MVNCWLIPSSCSITGLSMSASILMTSAPSSGFGLWLPGGFVFSFLCWAAIFPDLFTVSTASPWLGKSPHDFGIQVPKELGNQTDVHLSRDFFLRNRAVARSDTYINLREVSKRFHLPLGEYLIVPSTFEPFKDGEFCLRVFSEKHAQAQEIGDTVAANPYEPHVADNDIDNEFKSLFQKLSGEDCEMTANELQTVLNRVISKRTDIKSDGFGINTCREMISLLDSNGTGTLGITEFKILWMKIQKYLEIYKRADTDMSGTIDAHEMRNALKEAGFTLNNKIQHSITTRYACSKLTIDFDGFVACMIRLETLFKMFQILDKDNRGVVQLTLAEWLCSTLV